jgi:hypothetical protein
MPLSRAVRRKLLHHREIECKGYEREDGLIDIEAVLVDSKSYSFDNHDRGYIASGEPLHRMLVRLTIDADLVVHGIEASTEASPYDICGAIAPGYNKLIGLKIGDGWRKRVLERVAGTAGCTHITDLLLTTIPTIAMQTVAPLRRHRGEKRDPQQKPSTLDRCYAYASDGPVVAKHWPAFFTGAKERE